MKYKIIYKNGGSAPSTSDLQKGGATPSTPSQIETAINNVLTDSLKFSDLKYLINENILDSQLGIPDEIWLQNDKANSYKIPDDEQWTKIQVGEFLLETPTINTTIKINCYRYQNRISEESTKQILFLPGFSDNSFLWTLSRISKYKDEIVKQGFSDIFIFDFTAIGGNKNYQGFKGIKKGINFQKNTLHEQKELGIEFAIDKMYRKISMGLKELIEKRTDLFSNYSIAGRSAGGGLAIHLVLTHGLRVNGLNIACPGYDYNALEANTEFNTFVTSIENINLPIRLCHSLNDKKEPSNQSNILAKLIGDKFNNFIYYSISKIYDNDEVNHRFQEILLLNLV
jgi:hypothetical protein